MPKRRRVPVATWLAHERRNRAVPRGKSQARVRGGGRASSSEVTQSSLNFEQLAKLFGVVTIILYVVGLLAVNSYLFGLGASDFSLTRTRFIYTGVITSAALALTVFMPAAAILQLIGSPSGQHSQLTDRVSILEHRLSRFGRFLFACTLFLIPYFVFVLLQLLRTNIYTPSPDLAELPVILVRALLVYFLGFGAGVCIFGTIDARSKGGPELLGIRLPIVTPVVVGIVATLLFVTQFTLIAYPTIPDQYGGGRPILVRVLIDKDSTRQAGEIGIPIPEGRTLSTPVQLMYQGERMYIIQVDGRHAAQLSSDLVKGVVRVSLEEPTLQL